MITAQFIELGRNKVNKTVKVKDANALHKEVGKHILAKGWDMEQISDDEYAIVSGWNTVGKVKILSAE